MKQSYSRTVTLVFGVLLFPMMLIGQEFAIPSGANSIPPGSKIYIAPLADGYDTYLSAAIFNKHVPVSIVTQQDKANFEISGVTQSEKATWAKMLVFGSQASAEQASIKVVNLKTGEVVFGYNVNKSNSVRGKQSSAEACAKHLKEKIESGK